MKLREALECDPQYRLRQLMPDFCMDPESRKMLRQKGDMYFRTSGVSELLRDLSYHVAGQGFHSELELDGIIQDDTTVQRMLRWDPEQQTEGSAYMTHRGVIVAVRPLSGDIIIRGREAELIPRSMWRQNKDVLVQAIADAYRNPALITWPPAQIG